MILIWLLTSAWWLNLIDALVTWYGYTFFGMREANEMLGAAIRRCGLIPILAFKVLNVTWVIASFLWLESATEHFPVFDFALNVAGILMVTILSTAVAWNIWLTWNKFGRRI